jgi:hypothetical protein
MKLMEILTCLFMDKECHRHILNLKVKSSQRGHLKHRTSLWMKNEAGNSKEWNDIHFVRNLSAETSFVTDANVAIRVCDSALPTYRNSRSPIGVGIESTGAYQDTHTPTIHNLPYSVLITTAGQDTMETDLSNCSAQTSCVLNSTAATRNIQAGQLQSNPLADNYRSTKSAIHKSPMQSLLEINTIEMYRKWDLEFLGVKLHPLWLHFFENPQLEEEFRRVTNRRNLPKRKHFAFISAFSMCIRMADELTICT